MVNPDKFLRKAAIDLCKVFIPSWEDGVPIDVSPIPQPYLLIINQTRNPTEENKDGYEWRIQLTFDINYVRKLGYYGSAIVDDIEQQLMNSIEEIEVPGFVVKEIVFINSQPLTASSKTQTITRKVITYEFWLNNID